MGKRKLEKYELIQNPNQMNTTAIKRGHGLLKKAMELSKLTNTEVFLSIVLRHPKNGKRRRTMYSSRGNHPTHIQDIFQSLGDDTDPIDLIVNSDYDDEGGKKIRYSGPQYKFGGRKNENKSKRKGKRVIVPPEDPPSSEFFFQNVQEIPNNEKEVVVTQVHGWVEKFNILCSKVVEDCESPEIPLYSPFSSPCSSIIEEQSNINNDYLTKPIDDWAFGFDGQLDSNNNGFSPVTKDLGSPIGDQCMDLLNSNYNFGLFEMNNSCPQSPFNIEELRFNEYPF